MFFRRSWPSQEVPRGGHRVVCVPAGVKPVGMADPSAKSTVVMGAQVVLTLISCVLMKKLRRRTLLLFGSASVGHLVLAWYFSRLDVVPSMLAFVALFVFILGVVCTRITSDEESSIGIASPRSQVRPHWVLSWDFRPFS